jgi:hypothetical protein
MKEMTREEIKELKPGIEFVVYNPLSNQLKVEVSSPIDIAHNKYCYEKLKFYIKE